MRKLLLLLTIGLLGSAGAALGQLAPAPLAPGVRLPTPDTVQTRALLVALSSFLTALDQPPAAPAPDLMSAPAPTHLADFALLDELRAATAARRALPGTPYTFQVLSVVPLDSARYLVQLGCLGWAGPTPVLRAAYDLLARPAPGGGYAFGSPLRLNARGWRATRRGSFTFYSPTPPGRAATRAYAGRAARYDRRLGIAAPPRTAVYCCADFPEALRLVGVAYKADYAGTARNSLDAAAAGRALVVYGEGPLAQFDPHDLWHQRLRNAVPVATINRSVDEGCAYLYGGSWGRSWPQVLARFHAWATAQPQLQPDWLEHYENHTDFSDQPSQSLRVPYLLNALIVEQLERDKGFGAVKKLLVCGPYEAGNANYFRTLAEAAGITRENFNARVEQLIRNSRPAVTPGNLPR